MENIFQAARKAFPSGVDPGRGLGNFEKRLPESHVFVGILGDPGPSTECVVEVAFHLAAGRFEVSSAHYDPDREYEW